MGNSPLDFMKNKVKSSILLDDVEIDFIHFKKIMHFTVAYIPVRKWDSSVAVSSISVATSSNSSI